MAMDSLSGNLAVILHADIAESTVLVQQDERLAHERIQGAFRLFSETIEKYHGRVRELRGDALLADFARPSDAVTAALSFQANHASYIEQLNDDIQPVARIGIAMGEVIVADSTVTGAGVVLAQRVEQLSEPGGVCITAAIHEALPKRLPFDQEKLGEQTLKGFDELVQVYAVSLIPGGVIPEPEFLAQRDIATAELPDKPSIAVLPFTNLSGDSDQEYFADGISDDIITGLSRFHWFFVIARNSSFVFKGNTVDVKQISRDLGVKYVLEGSVRKSGNRVRISAQLIEATAGHHIWADRYDRNLEDIFAVQDEISEAITTAVAPAFVSAEAKRAERKAPGNFDAWDYAMRGNWHLSRGSKDDLKEARRLFEKALQLDFKNNTALCGLAFTLCWVNIFSWEDDLEAVRIKAYELVKRAIAHDDNDAFAHAILGWVRFTQRDLDGATAECRRALKLNPNLALAESILSICHSWRGDNEDALAHAIKAERLSPRDPAQSMWSFARSSAEFGLGHYEQAAEWAKLATDVMPEFPGAWRYLASSLGHLNRLEEAQVAARELLKVLPHDNIRVVREGLPSIDQDRIDRFVEGLGKAGIPE